MIATYPVKNGVKQLDLEYQQNNFSLQFCPAYDLPIWFHAFNITSTDFRLMLYGAKLEDCKQDKMQTKVILLVL